MDSNQTVPSSAKGPLSPTDTAILEVLVPGYTLISQFFLSYLKIDITAYFQYFIALVLLGASLRYVFRYYWTAFREHFICTAEIRLDDEVFNYVMYWISRQPFTQRTNRFVAGVKINGYWSDDEETDTEEIDEGLVDLGDSADSADTDPFEKYLSRRKKYRPLRYTPSQGRHLFWYRGRPIVLEREYKDLTTRWVLNNERLYLSCFGWDSSVIKTLMVEAQKAYTDRDRNRTIIYRAQKHGNAAFFWARCMARRPRPLSTVILGQQQKDAFINDMKDYLRQETWYTDRGIPYRRGYLFHGPPGTGKTSLCFAAAGKLRLDLYILSLNSKALDDDSLMTLFSELPRQCIVLLEDVDSAGVTATRSKPTRKKSKKQMANGATSDPDHDSATESADEGVPVEDSSAGYGITLSGLLNVMDGVAASEGRILIMTTNHRDKLDEALTRNGRVDMEVYFGYTTSTDIRQLFMSIYLPTGANPSRKQPRELSNGKLNSAANGAARHNSEKRESSAQQNGIHKKGETMSPIEALRAQITAQAAEFTSIVPGGELTAAEVQGYLLNHKNNPTSALKAAEAWVQEMRKKKGLAS